MPSPSTQVTPGTQDARGDEVGDVFLARRPPGCGRRWRRRPSGRRRAPVSVSRSTTLPLPSSPHCAPTTMTTAMCSLLRSVVLAHALARPRLPSSSLPRRASAWRRPRRTATGRRRPSSSPGGRSGASPGGPPARPGAARPPPPRGCAVAGAADQHPPSRGTVAAAVAARAARPLLQRAGGGLDVDGEADRGRGPAVAGQQAVVAAALQHRLGRAVHVALHAHAGVVVEAAHLGQVDVQARRDAVPRAARRAAPPARPAPGGCPAGRGGRLRAGAWRSTGGGPAQLGQQRGELHHRRAGPGPPRSSLGQTGAIALGDAGARRSRAPRRAGPARQHLAGQPQVAEIDGDAPRETRPPPARRPPGRRSPRRRAARPRRPSRPRPG